MALITDLFEDSLPGLVVGAVATAILMPLVEGPSAAADGGVASAGTGARVSARGRGRQLMKAAVHGSVGIADRLREATAEAREGFGDLVAEVREERRIQAESAADQAADGTAHEEPAATKSRRRRSQNGGSRRR
jgi:hypothetical protein